MQWVKRYRQFVVAKTPLFIRDLKVLYPRIALNPRISQCTAQDVRGEPFVPKNEHFE